MSARDALEPIASLFSLQYSEDQAGARIFDRNHSQAALLELSELVGDEEEPLMIRSRDHDNELPSEIGLNHAGVFSGYESENSYSRRLEGKSENSMQMTVPVVLPRSTAVGALEAGLRDIWIGRQKLEIGLPYRHLALSAGDVISLADGDSIETWRIDSIEDSDFRRIQLRGLEKFESLPVSASEGSRSASSQSMIQTFGAPQFIMMNLPLQPASEFPRT
jgi:hypothetical protein